MNTHIPPQEQTRVRGVSLRDSQWNWLREHAEQREGGNVSRVMRIIVEQYRKGIEAQEAAREMERVS